MKIRVKYFAILREAAGREEEAVDWQGDDGTLGGFLGHLGERRPEIGAVLRERPVLAAVNEEYAEKERSLKEGDEVALFPPVSGG